MNHSIHGHTSMCDQAIFAVKALTSEISRKQPLNHGILVV